MSDLTVEYELNFSIDHFIQKTADEHTLSCCYICFWCSTLIQDMLGNGQEKTRRVMQRYIWLTFPPCMLLHPLTSRSSFVFGCRARSTCYLRGLMCWQRCGARVFSQSKGPFSCHKAFIKRHLSFLVVIPFTAIVLSLSISLCLSQPVFQKSTILIFLNVSLQCIYLLCWSIWQYSREKPANITTFHLPFVCAVSQALVLPLHQSHSHTCTQLTHTMCYITLPLLLFYLNPSFSWLLSHHMWLCVGIHSH